MTYLRIQESTIFSNQQIIAQDAIKTVSNFIKEKISILKTTVWITDPMEVSESQQKEILESLLGLDPAFRQIALLDQQGAVHTQVSRLSTKALVAFQSQIEEKARDHLSEKQTFISSVYFDPLTGEPLVIITVPVFNVTRDFEGTLIAELNLKFMWDLVNQIKIGETGFAYVVDRQGNLLAFQDTARVLRGESVSNLKVVRDFINNSPADSTPNLSKYTGINGMLVLGSYSPLEIPDWAVVTELPWQEAYLPIFRIAWASLTVMLVLILLVSILGLYLAQWLSVPLVHLTETAVSIAGGNLGLQAQVTGPKEVSSLARAFNSMTEQLRHNLESLQEKIIEVQRAENALKEANETLHALFDFAPQALIMLDQNGTILMWNRAAEGIFGWTEQEVVGKFPPTIPEDRLDQFAEIRERINAGESITNMEVERLRNDGTRFLMDLSIAPIRNIESQIFAQISIGLDISERKRVEESLLRTQFTMDNTREAIVWIGEAGHLNYANKEACRMLGYSKEEVLSKTIFELDEMMTEQIWPYHWEAVRIHPSKKRESSLKTKEMGSIPVEVSSNFMSYAGKEYLSIFYQDISERKLAEAALRESEQKFRSVVENAQAVIFILDIEGKFVLSEGKGLEKLGLLPGEVVGKSALELYQSNPSIAESILRSLKGNVVRATNQLSDTTFDSVYSPYFDSEGVLCGVVGVAIDITDQKKAEEALQVASYALERVADGVYWIDENGKILETNESARRMLGMSREEMSDLTIMDIDPDMNLDQWHEEWIRLLAHQTFTKERIHRTKDGRFIPVEIVANFIAFGGRELDCALVRDITHRKQIEEGIRRLNTELEERVKERTLQLEAANKELEAFAYSVSHDLRAPLRAVDGYTRILVEDYESILDDDGKRVCSVIRDETRRMGQLIDDLLAFSRLSRAEMVFAPINMEKLVNSVFLELTGPESRQHITFQVPSLLPANGDSSMIRQVWVNLISNALKFSSKREQIFIEVNSCLIEGEIIYSIHDNGAGFDMRYADKLFGVFQRLHSEREFEGTGVGLAIVQRIIHRHSGRIWAESEVEKGTSFWFALPYKGDLQ